MQIWPIVQALLLLTAANGAPVLAKKVFGARFAVPLDGGVLFVDGRPLFGASKTIRGIAVSLVATAGLAPLVGASFATGGLVAAFAMVGDLFSSFVKRRLKLPPSSQAIGLDQIPESLLPLVVCRGVLALTLVDIALAVAVFLAGELIVSRLLYALHVRDQPY
jgi:CDP-diglyceride synthetase